ncbi:MAG TPA: DUF6657 family protein [Sphaerochaetaceae bacterium]|nr:DUF6657 family protein [Sphaerochaetaceae bacterium]
MALIKSAWEIALEKTEGIEADPEKMRRDKLINEGKRVAGTYLTDIESDGQELASAVADAPTDDLPLIKRGIASTVLMNIALPQSLEYEERIQKMQKIVKIIDGSDSETIDLMGKIGDFMGKYLEARDSLLERAKQQYQPMFEQKRDQMMQKYGRASGMSMEQDPEFVQFLQKHYAQLNQQYQQVLDQAKDQLKEAWELTE